MIEIIFAISILGAGQDPRFCADAIGADEEFYIACAEAIEAEREATEEALGGYDEYGRWDPMYNATVDRNFNIVPRSERGVPGPRLTPFSDSGPFSAPGAAAPGMSLEEIEMSAEAFLRSRGADVSPRSTTPGVPLRESWGGCRLHARGVRLHRRRFEPRGGRAGRGCGLRTPVGGALLPRRRNLGFRSLPGRRPRQVTVRLRRRSRTAIGRPASRLRLRGPRCWLPRGLFRLQLRPGWSLAGRPVCRPPHGACREVSESGTRC